MITAMTTETESKHKSSAQVPLDLSAMPPEIMAKIGAFIDRPRDLLAMRRASSLFAEAPSPRDAAVSWGAQRMHLLLCAGTPLDVVTAALAVRGRALYNTAVVGAVEGGRIDVVRAVMQHHQGMPPCEERDRDDGEIPSTITASRQSDITTCLVNAATLALRKGLVDVARHIFRKSRRVCDHVSPRALAERAASGGHLNAFAFVHDFFLRKYGSCECDAAVGDAAWRSPTPDIIEWMRDSDCTGVVPLSRAHVMHAIEHNHQSMIRYMAVADLDLLPDRHEPDVTFWITQAAQDNLKDLLVLLVEIGLCTSLTPILVGGANADLVELMEWALDPAGPCLTRLALPDRHATRAAIVAAATSNSACALNWLLERFGTHLVDPTSLVWAALVTEAKDSIVIAESLLREPFPWGAALLFALRSSPEWTVRHALDKWGGQLTATEIMAISGRIPDDPVLDLLCARCEPGQLQDAINAMSALGEKGNAGTIQGLKRRLPQLCTATVAAMETDTMLTCSPHDGVADLTGPCLCNRCTADDDVDDGETDRRQKDNDAVWQRQNLPPPGKRAKTDSA